ncbi:MAG: UPF0104 family protein [Chlorobiaceae bacterium]|nr:UPF0104 family protein [Chlorobiaceae bacterium]NTW63291.1 UPF0104 family protein [Chlorobiaceae bacterium]
MIVDAKKKQSSWPGYAGVILGVILLVFLFRRVDFRHSLELVSSIGISSLLVFLPFLGLHLIETAAWIKVFPPSVKRPAFFPLFKIQVIAETVSMTLPAGIAVGEPLRPFLCNRFLGIAVPSAVASVAVRKLLLGAAQGLFTVIGAIAGFGLLQDSSRSILGFNGLGVIVLSAGVAVTIAFLFFVVLLINGNAAAHLHGLLMLVPFRKVREWLLEKESGFTKTDTELKSYRGPAATRLLLALVYYVFAWMLLAVESYIILRLLGVDVSFQQVLAFDTALAMLRSLFFFIPSGIGIQDLGYLAFFQAIGIPDYAAYGGAFVLLRRFKEIVWYGLGYLIMFISGVHLNDASKVSNE